MGGKGEKCRVSDEGEDRLAGCLARYLNCWLLLTFLDGLEDFLAGFLVGEGICKRNEGGGGTEGYGGVRGLDLNACLLPVFIVVLWSKDDLWFSALRTSVAILAAFP